MSTTVLPFIVTSTSSELDAEEQVAVQPSDRQPAVHVVLGLLDDEAAQPLLEPGRLRDDDRHRGRADDQRAEKSDDLQRPRLAVRDRIGSEFKNAWPMLK